MNNMYEEIQIEDHMVDPDPLINAPEDHKLLCDEPDCLEPATLEFGSQDEDGTYYTYRCANHPDDTMPLKENF